MPSSSAVRPCDRFGRRVLAGRRATKDGFLVFGWMPSSSAVRPCDRFGRRVLAGRRATKDGFLVFPFSDHWECLLADRARSSDVLGDWPARHGRMCLGGKLTSRRVVRAAQAGQRQPKQRSRPDAARMLINERMPQTKPDAEDGGAVDFGTFKRSSAGGLPPGGAGRVFAPLS